jgi:Uma2 family endonuclease
MYVEKQMTPEEFLAFAEQHPDKRFDFIDGEMVETFSKPLQGRIRAILIAALGKYAQSNPIGVVHTSVLHVLNGEMFIPDVSLNPTSANDADYFTTPPLVAIEIRSDSQTEAAQRRKALRYIKHGTPMVILVLPRKSVEVHRQGKSRVLTIDDTLDGDDVLPGFKLPVRDILPI